MSGKLPPMMMPLKTIVAVLFTCGLLPAVFADDNPLEKQLADRYHDQILVLRHSFKSSSQEYAADGSPLNASEEGAWAVYGRMLVTKLKVDGDRLQLEGKRMLYVFDPGGRLAQFPEDPKHPTEKIKITVRLPQPLSSVDEAATVLGRIFAVTPDHVVNSAPAYWHDYLAKQVAPQPGEKAQASSYDQKQTQEELDPAQATGQEVFHIGDQGVTPPKILYQREPNYSDEARSRKIQGPVGLTVVVDPTGKVRNIKIVRPLGLGLDDSAVATIGTWRFQPGTKDGQPVAVELYIGVDFHLY
jgi:TonB family protein